VKIGYPDGAKAPDTNLHAIHDKTVSIMPFQLDFSNYSWRERLTV